MPLKHNLNEVYPPHLLAQKLNNRAVQCIEVGQYGDAITNIVKALRLSEIAPQPQDFDETATTEETTGCFGECCSLRNCMTYSHQHASSNTSSITDSVDKTGMDCGYLYAEPIQVPPLCMEECHYMGLVLPLILTFNLALAHHLEALREASINRSKLQRVLRLYELAYRWQMEGDDSQVECIRFSMIIANNLSEVHRAVSNHGKHHACLKHLLSTLMFAIDCNEMDRNAIDMDGFFRNTSELILHSRCAGAA